MPSIQYTKYRVGKVQVNNGFEYTDPSLNAGYGVGGGAFQDNAAPGMYLPTTKSASRYLNTNTVSGQQDIPANLLTNYRAGSTQAPVQSAKFINTVDQNSSGAPDTGLKNLYGSTPMTTAKPLNRTGKDKVPPAVAKQEGYAVVKENLNPDFSSPYAPATPNTNYLSF
jgi:hypothetical protein